ncbi:MULTISPECIES: membrane protein insertase YidC [Flavobacteriaceae]|uniref:Membrane protein insertase YidC n=2 Tax=Flavobacteriaceae TaxID=49546 RepID=A0A4Y8AVQ2_9FLAO|nr:MULTISPECIES: membrane protein insertase YidC [Flavobacteriaceae]TEW75452.1 membrane protein insertase YidC [Gramella jeungdoensis]GGK45291.1 membrane protein insertase YidC [Lutibacter litoralis]
MEQKKFDFNSLIGFVLLGAIMLWWMYSNQPTPEEQAAQEKAAEIEQVEATKATTNTATFNDTTQTTLQATDSLSLIKAKGKLGDFGYSATIAEGETILENNVLKLVISNKGGQIKEALIKNYVTYDSLPLYIVKDQNASFNINFGTSENRILNTKDLMFEPTLTTDGSNEVLSMKLKVSDSRYLEYRYEMKPDEYMVDFNIRSQGLSTSLNSAQQITLDWSLDGFSHEKSIRYENQQTEMYYEKGDEDIDYLSVGGEDDAEETDVNWVAFKQHFFSAILISDKAFDSAKLTSVTLTKDEEIDTVFTKAFALKAPLALDGGEFNYNMNWYIGPNDYQILKKYDRNIKEIVNLGWGIFGYINRLIFVPVFNFLQGFIGNYGVIIILLTIVVRIIMSPLVYKSYLSSAKMKVLKPEMEEINKRLPGKENAMKRQQETMAVQSKAGVSPLSGCIPALLQMPVFFALFRFFPSNIDLRQKGFLWADDLSSYDSVFELPFHIPMYGSHISLFPILASVAIFFYMRMSQSQQMGMQQPTQEGMPDMQKMMKMMMYLSPVMMLIFFNMYASSLSLYYFVSNLLTITIMLVIKHYIIDEEKIHAKIEENKKKPKKEGKFRKRLNDAMKQAQEQQAKQQKKR